MTRRAGRYGILHDGRIIMDADWHTPADVMRTAPQHSRGPVCVIHHHDGHWWRLDDGRRVEGVQAA